MICDQISMLGTECLSTLPVLSGTTASKTKKKNILTFFIMLLQILNYASSETRLDECITKRASSSGKLVPEAQSSDRPQFLLASGTK